MFDSNTISIIEIGANIAVVLTFVATIIMFRITARQNNRTEEVKIVSEILKSFSEAENKMKEAKEKLDEDKNKQTQKSYDIRVLQYFDVWEWFASLINTHTLSEKSELVVTHLKSTFMGEYEYFIINSKEGKHTRLKEAVNDTGSRDFKEIKLLYDKWKDANNNN